MEKVQVDEVIRNGGGNLDGAMRNVKYRFDEEIDCCKMRRRRRR